MPMYRSQSEAARIFDIPESTLRSWIKAFRPYVLVRPGEQGKPVYEMDRLTELVTICNEWGKKPKRRSQAEIGRELARRYPVEARAGGIRPPPETEADAAEDAPSDRPRLALDVATRSEAASAVSLLPELVERLIETSTALAEIPAGIERMMATRPTPEHDLLVTLENERGELRALLLQAKAGIEALAEVTPVLVEHLKATREQNERQAAILRDHLEVTRENHELQAAILAFMRARGDRPELPWWRWLNPSFCLALLMSLRSSGRGRDDDPTTAASSAPAPSSRPTPFHLVAPREDS